MVIRLWPFTDAQLLRQLERVGQRNLRLCDANAELYARNIQLTARATAAEQRVAELELTLKALGQQADAEAVTT